MFITSLKKTNEYQKLQDLFYKVLPDKESLTKNNKYFSDSL